LATAESVSGKSNGEAVDNRCRSAVLIQKRIADFPEIYGQFLPGIRAAVTDRFGCVMYYRVQAAFIEVLAVLHGNRDERSIRKNLR